MDIPVYSKLMDKIQMMKQIPANLHNDHVKRGTHSWFVFDREPSGVYIHSIRLICKYTKTLYLLFGLALRKFFVIF